MQDNIAKEIIKIKYLSKLPYLSEERTQKFISIVLTLLALSFFGFFAINPTISTILKLQKELSDSEFVYDQLVTKIENLSELRKQYSSLQNDLPIVTDAIPVAPNVHLLFAQIQTVAQQSNISIKKLQSSEVEVIRSNSGSEKPYYSYSFSIGGSGPFESVYNFVSILTNMQRIVNIEIFSTNNTLLQDTQSLEFNIQGTAFFKE